MVLKGGSPVHEGDERADAWPLDEMLRATARRCGIVPERDLVRTIVLQARRARFTRWAGQGPWSTSNPGSC